MDLVLSELQVGKNEDLLALLANIRVTQRLTGHSLVLLSDENIHYRIAKMLYGESLAEFA